IGFTDAWIASENRAEASDASLRVVDRDYDSRMIGRRRLVAFPAGRRLLSVNGHRYRGLVEILVDETGRLSVINEVNLEDYLRGVVPEEMGPGVYPELQALEAQTVAARTYAVRNRGQFAEEGYDICDSARCQVYGGADSEHPLTDRAVTRTTGEVLTYQGALVNSLFTSTCGGHTEDVANVFPEQAEPYLKGVRCRPEADGGVDVFKRLRGSRRLRFLVHAPELAQAVARLHVAGLLQKDDLAAGALSGSLPPERWSRWLERLSPLLGRSSRRQAASEGARLTLGRAASELVDLLDWQEREAHLVPPGDVAVLVGDGHAGVPVPVAPHAGDLALLLQMGLVAPAGSSEPWSEEISGARAILVLDRLMRRYGSPILNETRVKSFHGTSLELTGGVRRSLAEDAYLFQSLTRGGAPVPVESLPLTLDEPIFIHLDESGGIDYLEARRPFRTLSDDRFSNRLTWEVRIGREQLGARLNRSLSLGELRDLSVVSRGASGRVTELELLGSKRRIVLKGFDIRVVLKLDETLFTVDRFRNEDGIIQAFVFAGRGWGHGVGLCQVGAYGMAVRGRDYRQILTHYYTGVCLDSIRIHPALLDTVENTPLR
ncbi:MAG: SpoIID/LytB domain-containing protein, partial [Acidobacteriota bacterium]